LSTFYATKHSAGLELKLTTYEQIRIVFTRSHHRHGGYRFLHAAGNDWDHNGTGSYRSVTDSGAAGAP
jgi:hypothetical protein